MADRPKVKSFPDRPLARSRALEAWFGGMPSPQEMDARQKLAEKELRRWEALIPGTPAHRARRGREALAGGSWVNIGPHSGKCQKYGSSQDLNVVDTGRPTVILPHPTNAKRLYAGFAGGGVWRCDNADLASNEDWAWKPLTDALPAGTASGNLSVGGLDFKPEDPNTLYLALGDMEPGSADSTAEGRGFYISTDGGDTWTLGGSLGSTTRVRTVMALPGGVVLVAGNNGLWRSTDSGQTFTPVTVGSTVWCWTLVKTASGRLVMTAQSGNAAGSIWTSTDQGATWSAASLDASMTALNGRRMSVAASSGNTLYTIIESKAHGRQLAQGVGRSVDGGLTWTFVAAPTLFASDEDDGFQGSYNQMLAVDPTNANQLFLGTNLTLWRSQDGGATWKQLTQWMGGGHVYVHADYHVHAWAPVGPKALYMGTDGGLAIIRDPDIATIPTSGSTTYVPSDPAFIDHRRNKGVATHMVYHLGSTNAQTPADARYRVSVGLQDMGTRIRTGADVSTSRNYDLKLGGDGFGTLIHPLNGDLMLGSLYFTRIYRSTNGGSTFSSTSGIAEANNEDAAPFLTRISQGYGDPSGDTVYTFVYQKVYESKDFGATWNALGTSGFPSDISIRAVGAAPSDPLTLGLVATGGRVFLTKDGGQNWALKGSLPNHNKSLGWIAFDPQSADVIYVTSVAQNSAFNHLWKSTNGGTSWTALDTTTSGLPAGIPIHCVVVDPVTSSTVYAGTDFGVYQSTDGDTSWKRFGTDLPLVSVREIYVAPDSSFIRIGTHGRGVWEISPSTDAKAPQIVVPPKNATVYTGQTATFSATASGSFPMTFQWQKNGQDIAGATQSYLRHTAVAGDNGATFTLKATNAKGSDTSTKAVLTVNQATPPAVTSQPQSMSVFTGEGASLSVTATGTDPLLYQWRKNGTAVQGATARTLTFPMVTMADGGSYDVVITNGGGTTTSSPAVLTVTQNPNYMMNAGFEGGSLGWSFFDPGMVIPVPNQDKLPAHAGSAFCWIGAWDKPTTDYISQTVTLPATCTTAPLTFWMSITNLTNTPAAATNVMSVQVVDPANQAVLETLATFDNTKATADYAYSLRGPWDLKAYKGRTITLKFTSVQPGGSGTGTSFLVDDFSLKPEIGISKDIDQNGSIDIFDLGVLVRAMGSSTGQAAFNVACDLNADGKVDQADLDLFLATF